MDLPLIRQHRQPRTVGSLGACFFRGAPSRCGALATTDQGMWLSRTSCPTVTPHIAHLARPTCKAR